MAITDVIYLPNGLIHMELLHSDDMVIIEYILYAYNYNNQIIKEYKSDNTLQQAISPCLKGSSTKG